MTSAPANLLAARQLLLTYLNVNQDTVRAADLEPGEVGIVGNSAHRGGYHCGSDRVTGDDYSVRESSRDRAGLTLDASALDVGLFEVRSPKGVYDLPHFSAWCVAQCVAGTPDTRDIREIIWSPDGRTVRRWDRLKKRTTGDTSHRTHTHFSFFRDAIKAGRDLTPLFRRYLTTIGLIEQEDIMATIADLRQAIRDELHEALPLQSQGLRNANPAVKGISTRVLLEYAWSDARQARSGVAALRAELARMAGRDVVDEQQLAAELAPALLAVLTPQAIGAAIPEAVAKQVADVLAARMAG